MTDFIPDPDVRSLFRFAQAAAAQPAGTAFSIFNEGFRGNRYVRLLANNRVLASGTFTDKTTADTIAAFFEQPERNCDLDAVRAFVEGRRAKEREQRAV